MDVLIPVSYKVNKESISRCDSAGDVLYTIDRLYAETMENSSYVVIPMNNELLLRSFEIPSRNLPFDLHPDGSTDWTKMIPFVDKLLKDREATVRWNICMFLGEIIEMFPGKYTFQTYNNYAFTSDIVVPYRVDSIEKIITTCYDNTIRVTMNMDCGQTMQVILKTDHSDYMQPISYKSVPSLKTLCYRHIASRFLDKTVDKTTKSELLERLNLITRMDNTDSSHEENTSLKRKRDEPDEDNTANEQTRPMKKPKRDSQTRCYMPILMDNNEMDTLNVPASCYYSTGAVHPKKQSDS